VNDWVADWDDVLHRAGPSRFPSRRAAAVAAVAAVAVVLVLPGIGIGGGLNAWISGSRPGLHLRAVLALPSGKGVGTLSLGASRIFVAVTRKPPFFIPRGHKPVLPPVPVRWSLDLQGVSARSAVIENGKGHVIARLCSPCSDGAHGTVMIRPRAVLDAFRGTAVVKTSRGTARGMLRLPTPVR
jgi:hypothetical protein